MNEEKKKERNVRTGIKNIANVKNVSRLNAISSHGRYPDGSSAARYSN